jgi:hypothetical protein
LPAYCLIVLAVVGAMVRGILVFLAMTAGALAGCSGFSKNQQLASDPNAVPTNYRNTLVAFLRQSLTDQADFRGAMISEPAIKPIEASQHYVVCVQFSPKSKIKTKAAVFLSGQMTQFVDAAPEQCADAAYQPFKELDAASPSGPSRQDILNDPRGTH